MLSPTQQSCAHRGEFFTVIALATPATFDVRTMDFIGCGKAGGFTHGVVVCGRVKGTLRIALRNGAGYDRYDRRTRENLSMIVGSRWRRNLSSPRDDYFVNFFAASPKNEHTLAADMRGESNIVGAYRTIHVPTQRCACLSLGVNQHA